MEIRLQQKNEGRLDICMYIIVIYQCWSGLKFALSSRSQEYSLYFSPKFANFLYGLANQKLCYIQMLQNIESLENKTKNILENGW